MGALSHSHREVLPTHMRRADVLGIELPFAPWMRYTPSASAAFQETIGYSSPHWRCASGPGFSEPRRHSTSTTAMSRTRSGRELDFAQLIKRYGRGRAPSTTPKNHAPRALGIDRPQRRGITTGSLHRSRQNSTQREFRNRGGNGRRGGSSVN